MTPNVSFSSSRHAPAEAHFGYAAPPSLSRSPLPSGSLDAIAAPMGTRMLWLRAPAPSPASSVRFGFAGPPNGKIQALFITPEPREALKGGLGEVSGSVPSSIRAFSDRLAVSTLEPFGAAMQDKPGWQDTGLKVQLSDFPTPAMEASLSWLPAQARYALAGVLLPKQPFTLMQNVNPETGHVRWAIANDRYIKPYTTIYGGPDKVYSEIRDLNGAKTMAMFNRAGRAFMPYLAGFKPLPSGASVATPPGGLHAVWANDAHVAPILSSVKEDLPKMGRYMMIHNTYDVSLPVDGAEAMGMNVAHNASSDPSQFSQLAQGIQDADKVIIDLNYKETLLNKGLIGQAPILPALRAQDTKGAIAGIHHFLDPTFNPATHPALTTDGFVQLQNGAAGMAQFKRHNKAALQKWAGLKQDPDATIISWVARFDPSQKGFAMLMQSIKTVLDKYPKAQFVIGGTSDVPIPGMPKLIADLTDSDSPYAGRVYLPNKLVDRPTTVKIYAGSDICALPSIYEPYGLTQLETLTMGAMPLATAVDGLRSTLSDPTVNSEKDGPRSKAWDYGQTAVLFKLPDATAYRNVMGPLMNGEKLTEKQQATMNAGTQAFQEAVDRAMAIVASPETLQRVRENGQRYMADQHAIPAIVKRYEGIFDGVAPQTLKPSPPISGASGGTAGYGGSTARVPAPALAAADHAA